MKFSVSCGDLLARLQTMGKVIEDKNSLPVLGNFLFSLQGDVLVLTASNNEMRMTSAMPVSNQDGTDGNVCIPGAKLTEYLKYLPEQPVTFNIPDGSLSLEITSQSGKSLQACVDASDYPAEQPLEDSSSVTVTEDILLSGITMTLFATADDNLRPVMNGVFMEMEPGKVTFVATDTHKMARYIRTDVSNADVTGGIVISKKTANLLKGILSRVDSPVKVSFGAKNVVFESQDYKFASRLVEGDYPNYKSVIPAGGESRVVVNRADFIKALSRASVFVDATHLVRCELFSNSIQISTQDLDFSCSANETIPCEYVGREMAVGFSGTHLTSSLNNIDATEVAIELTDPSRPGLLAPAVKSDKEDVLIIIMPMKI